MKCPKCSSEDVEIIDYLGVKCRVCNKCGYDETSEYETFPQGRSSQKAKGRYSPYKTGGGHRTRK